MSINQDGAAPEQGNSPFAAPDDQPAKRKGGFQWRRIVVSIISVVVIGAGIAWFQGGRDFASAPKVGECGKLKNNEVSTVDCGATDAEFKVVKAVENTQDADTACADAAAATSSVIYENGPKHFVLCVTDL